MRTSSSGFTSITSWQWGMSDDVPVPVDYDGDGRMEVAVYRPLTGEWFVREKFTITWGASGDVPVKR